MNSSTNLNLLSIDCKDCTWLLDLGQKFLAQVCLRLRGQLGLEHTLGMGATSLSSAWA